MMMDNQQLNQSIREALLEMKADLRVEIAKIEAHLEMHRGDQYAHREMVGQYQGQTQEWVTWRSKVDTRFAYLSGGLAVLTFFLAIFGGLLVQRLFLGH